MPDAGTLPEFPVRFRTDPDGFHPFARDPQTLARGWAVPGTPGLAHRIGGLEKSAETGDISYDPDNHERMTALRRQRVQLVADDVPEQVVQLGEAQGELALVGWGSTFGALHQAVRQLRHEGRRVSHIHLRYLFPFPRNLGTLLAGFERVLVPEMNTGQLVTMLRSEYLLPAVGLNKVQGRPFRIAEIVDAVRAMQETR